MCSLRCPNQAYLGELLDLRQELLDNLRVLMLEVAVKLCNEEIIRMWIRSTKQATH